MLNRNWHRSSIGKKALMAASGLALLGFVIAHLLGNLLVFAGPDALNAYALKLRKLGVGLWAARLSLLAVLIIHVWTSVQLSIENRRARPVPYKKKEDLATTAVARRMMLSGGLLFVYILYHLLHFTFRTTHPELSQAVDPLGHHDVYRMVIASFQVPGIALTYVVSMALLALHLGHGIGSSFQTLGVTNARTIPLFDKAGQAVAFLLFAGYCSIPLAVLMGYVR